MNVKILLFPLSITGALALSIFYIKPEFDTVMKNKEALKLKQEEASQIEIKVRNLASLESDLRAHTSDVDFLKSYYPEKRDDDKVVDAVNFLSSQSGLALVSVKIDAEALKSVQAEEELQGSKEVLMSKSGSGEAGAQSVQPIVSAKQRKVGAVVSAVGSYENIRDTLAKLSHVDRLHNFSSVSVVKKESAGGNGATANDGKTLTVAFKTDVPYMNPATSKNNLNLPLLEQSSFDYKHIASLRDLISSPVPKMELGETGKTNPFLR